MKVGATRKGASRGAAWLSSARVVRCWVKSRNERNPCVLLPPGESRSTRDRLPRLNEEEGGDDVKSVWPLRPGLHTYYNARHKGKQDRKVEQIPKARPSSDRGLQLALVKVESLVIADQHGRGEYVPGPCTHRPSHHESPLQPKLPLVGNEIVIGDWGEVVTR